MEVILKMSKFHHFMGGVPPLKSQIGTIDIESGARQGCPKISVISH